MNKRVVLLTGASAGLGFTLARKLAADTNYITVLTARSSSCSRFKNDPLFAAENIWLRDLDLIDHRQIAKVVGEIEEKLGGIDILINNAGISEHSTVEDSSDSSRQRLLDVNYLAPFELIAQALPSMRRKGFGKIINVSSVGGFMAAPTMSAYCASKFALEAASESLWYEMKPWGISITLIVPGFINSTGYLNTKDTTHGRNSAKDCYSAYFEHYRGMKRLIETQMNNCSATNESVTNRILQVMKSDNPPLRVHVTTESLKFYWMRKLLPPRMYLLVIYSFLPGIRRWGKQQRRKSNGKDVSHSKMK